MQTTQASKKHRHVRHTLMLEKHRESLTAACESNVKATQEFVEGANTCVSGRLSVMECVEKPVEMVTPITVTETNDDFEEEWIDLYSQWKQHRSVSFSAEQPKVKERDIQPKGSIILHELVKEINEIKKKYQNSQAMLFKTTESLKKAVHLGIHWKQIAENYSRNSMTHLDALHVLLDHVPSFGGNPSELETFLYQFDKISKKLEFNRYPDLWKSIFCSKLVLDASSWYQRVLWEKGPCSVPEWIQRIQEEYAPKPPSGPCRHIKQGNMSVRTYYKLFLQEYTGPNKTIDFVNGLRTKEWVLDYKRKCKYPMGIEECLHLACLLEIVMTKEQEWKPTIENSIHVAKPLRIKK
jgi:hypothetical protein